MTVVILIHVTMVFLQKITSLTLCGKETDPGFLLLSHGKTEYASKLQCIKKHNILEVL